MSPIEMLTFRQSGGGGDDTGGEAQRGVRGEAGNRFCDFILND